MPIHDWTRVSHGTFHHFHVAWVVRLSDAPNAGLLPPDHYALAEQMAGSIGPDVIALQTPGGPPANGQGKEIPGTTAVAIAPPRVRQTVRVEVDAYTRKRRTIVIRHSSNHRIVALIEVLSPGNKSSRNAIRSFLDKAASALAYGIHLLLIDLHPPGPRDPQGIQVALWERLTGDPPEVLPDRPLTLASYPAGPVREAYVEPVAVGDVLPDMPLFLDPEQYVNVPLETTYQTAYAGVPKFYRDILEQPALPGGGTE